MNKQIFIWFFIFITGLHYVQAQNIDDILDSLTTNEEPVLTVGTFKGTRLLNGQSVELPPTSDLSLNISHRFGKINSGIYDFFGLDYASNRIGFAYGIKDRIGLSIGRNSYEKTYDGSLKISVLRQKSGAVSFPFTLALYSAMYVNTLKWEYPERENLFSSRLSYCHQILIARKFSKNLSLQLSPTYIHKNLVTRSIDQNNIYAIGAGGRYKIFRKISFNSEYFYVLPGQSADDFENSLSFGFDIETGGHVFQLNLTNSTAFFEENFITETTGKWSEGEIHFGFHLTRVFPLSKNRRNID